MTRAAPVLERITIEAVAVILGVPLRNVYRLASRGEIPGAAKFGKRWTFNKRAIMFWIRKGGAKRLRSPAPSRRGVVYVVRCGDFVKIGFSKALKRRLPSIQTGAPERLTVLAEVSATSDNEKALHKRFMASRTHGDWFRHEGEVAAWTEAGCPL